MLLGGAQVLEDGGRLVFVRQGPDEKLVRDLWALLPYSTRTGLWPASFAFANTHGFHLLVVPRAEGPAFARYMPEEQAGDYPEGRYELALQHAVEDGDQAELDRLLSRRGRAQTFRLAVVLLVAFAVAALFLRLPSCGQKSPPAEKDGQVRQKDEKLELPLVEHVPPLSRDEEARLARRLGGLGKALGIDLPAGNTGEDLATALDKLDRGLDQKMGDRKPARNPGRELKRGPVRRRLQALLWKHGVADYNQPGLNVDEMVDLLRGALVQEGVLKEKAGE